MPGTTSFGATILGPGKVLHAGTGPTAIGELDGKLTTRIKRHCRSSQSIWNQN